MPATAACTIVARNYVAFAATLAESLSRYHPNIPFYVLVVDEVGPAHENHEAPFRRVTLSDVDTPDLNHFLFRYDSKQAIAAKKPSLIRHLLDQGYANVVYLDADMLVLDDLSKLFETVSTHALSLTPHFCSISLDPARFNREHQLLMVGIYNAGLIGVTNCTESHRFLAWWDARLHEWCKPEVRRGFHYDQRWLDMAPAYVEDLYIHREYDWNLAYWNLPDVDDVSTGSKTAHLMMNGRPCKIFHFSGFDPHNPSTLSRFPNALDADKQAHITALLRYYEDSLRRHGVETTIQTPWRWDEFSNGVRIPACVRRVFASLGPGMAAFPDPFDSGHPKSFYHWLREPVNPATLKAQPQISRLWQALYDQNPAIQARFPRQNTVDQAAFTEWTATQGLDFFELSDEFALTSSIS